MLSTNYDNIHNDVQVTWGNLINLFKQAMNHVHIYNANNDEHVACKYMAATIYNICNNALATCMCATIIILQT